MPPVRLATTQRRPFSAAPIGQYRRSSSVGMRRITPSIVAFGQRAGEIDRRPAQIKLGFGDVDAVEPSRSAAADAELADRDVAGEKGRLAEHALPALDLEIQAQQAAVRVDAELRAAADRHA